MKFFFRVDASKQIGTGHVYRCVSLALALKKLQYTCVFICRAFEGNLVHFVQQSGFECKVLPAELSDFMENKSALVEPDLKHSAWLNASQQQDAIATLQALQTYEVESADWMIIDHFALDAYWEGMLTTTLNCRVAVLDGQADRAHLAEVLIDPNLCSSAQKWQSLIQPDTRLYHGFPYIPLAPAFFEQQPHARIRNQLHNVLIAFGGVDQLNYTQRAVEALLELPAPFAITVVVGQHYPFKAELTELCSQHNVNLKVNVSDMDKLMLQADLAIGAGGTMAWERCMLYLPTLVTAIADNQLKQVDCLESKGLAIKLSSDLVHYADDLKQTLNMLLKNHHNLSQMSQKAKSMVMTANNQAWLKVFAG